MNLNSILKIVIIVAILVITISVAYYYVIFLPRRGSGIEESQLNDTVSIVDETLKCLEVWEKKKNKYFDNEIGQYGVIFNENLNTCLAFNLHINFQTDYYFGMVIDLLTDKVLVSYSSDPQGIYFDEGKKISCEHYYVYLSYFEDGEEIKKYGCEKYELMDEMFEKVREFGFQVFDPFSK